MSLNGNNVIGSSGYRTNQPPYEIDQSLRFNAGDSAYLSRTPSSASNRKTWTWSGWVKHTNVDSARAILNAGADNNNRTYINLQSDGTLTVGNSSSGSYTAWRTTSQVFRDPSAWYHFVIALDTTQSSASNRLKIYVNGEQVTDFSTSNDPTQDADYNVNNTVLHTIQANSGLTKYNGYLAEVNFIDGQALTPASFGETNSDTNQWVPIEVTGMTYGTNGFYLSFSSTELANSFTDSSSSSHTITANGDVTNSRAQKKIGSSSIKFDGTGDYLEMPDSSDWDFGSGSWTVEGWFNVSSWTDSSFIWNHWQDDNNFVGIRVLTGGDLNILSKSSGSVVHNIDFTSVDLPTDTWVHLAVVRDTSAGNFVIYKDGTSVGSSSNSTAMPNVTGTARINGGRVYGNYWTGYLDEFRVSDTARYTSSFTPSTTAFTADSNTKLLIHSDFNGGIGADSSGNTNDFSATNLVATDQVLDSPTNNFATLNPLNLVTNTTLSEGNLKADCTTSNDGAALGTMAVSSGKWYWEVLQTTANANNDISMGVMELSRKMAPQAVGTDVYPNAYLYGNDGWNAKYNSTTSTINTYGAGDIIGWALDLDGNTLKIYKNNSLEYTYSSGVSGTFTPLAAVDGTSGQSVTHIANFGQDSSFNGEKTAQGNTDGNGIGDFYYTPPSGFVALCSDNLSDPSIADPTKHFNTVLRTATGTSGGSVTGVGFQPDMIWQKRRSATSSHYINDVIRGSSKILVPNDTAAESTDAQWLVSFDSDGYTIGNQDWASGGTVASWNWKAGGAASTNEDGSIDSSVSANTTAGFSIVSWTGTGSNVTVGHGLSQAPELVINKSRGDAYNWAIQSFLWNSASDTNLLYLNTTAGTADDTNVFQAAPTATVFSPQGGSWAGIGTNTIQYIAYCFHSVDGYSKVGKYTGNSAQDGSFVYTGFRPAFIFIKRITSSGSNSYIVDNKRIGYNHFVYLTDAGSNKYLWPDSSAAEGNGNTTKGIGMDILSNGFKFRTTGSDYNASGNDYLFYAIAESPFKYSNAR